MYKPIAQKRLDNNSKAYTELVYALDKRKMMEGTPLTAVSYTHLDVYKRQ